MRKYLQLAAFPLASIFVAGCVSASSDEPDAPAPAPRRQSAAPMPTVPRVVGPPAPLLARPVAIPDVKLPSPNGYDLLARASKSIQPGGEGTPATAEKLSPEEDLRRQRAFTQKNAASLALMRQALKLPVVTPPTRGTDLRMGARANVRTLARLVMQENRVHAADQKWDRAVQGGLDIVEMATVLQNGEGTMGMLSGSAIEAMGRGEVAKWRGQLSEAQAGQAARRLEAIEARRPSYADVAQQEMWSSLSMMRDVLQSPSWKKVRDGSDPRGYASMFEDKQKQERLRQTSDQQIEANLVAALQATVARARLPYSPRLPIVPDPADPLSALYISGETSRGVTTYRVIHERNRAASRLLAADLALQASVKPSDKYPQSLAELVPKYLRAIPRDPFAPASPLRYKSQGDTFLLYSVGPDGVDNGGEPIEGRGISLDSVGDLLPSSFK